ncbi:HAMP domain-containing protein [Azospirillum thermophilum]|uniref:HAMP domain-containing protein n=1 Tax=Azospirillum thermophilum TaxID=2202148 RepID=UPI001B3BA491|nr:cache domain-containing protein [Azospirillum thermophilum]
MTLLTRLFLLVLLAVVPALGMQLHSVLQLRSERAGEIVAQAERILHMVEGEQSHIVESARLMLAAVAEASFLRTNDVPRCQTYLNRLVRSSEGYRAISVADRDGRILCSGDPSRIGATMADLPHFRRALMEERFVVGEWQPGSSAAGSSAAGSSAAGSPDDGGELPVAVPFRGEDGTLGGVVTAALDAPWLTRNFAARPLPGNASLIVADRSGTVLVKLPAGTAGIGEKLPASHLALLGAERMGVAALPGLDGVPRVMAFSPATAGVRDLFIGVGIDQAAAMGAIDRATRDGVLMTLAGLVVAIAAAWIGGTWFIRRPVEALVHAAQCWRTGDSAARANLADRSSEIGRLGQAFDAMAETLETREAALRASERHTRAVLDALPVLIGVLTTDGVVVQVNHAAAQALGLPAKRIVGNPFGQVCCLSQGEDGAGGCARRWPRRRPAGRPGSTPRCG